MINIRKTLISLLSFLIAWVFALEACKSDATKTPPATKTPALVDSVATQLIPTPADTPATPTPIVPAIPEESFTKYSLIARLDYTQHYLSVDEQIDYINRTSVPLRDLILVVQTNLYFAGFQLKEISWGNGQPITDNTLEGVQLLIPLIEPLQPGDRVQLSLSYESHIPQLEGPYGYTERQTNLGDWYPFVPPYVPGEGWLVRNVAYMGEYLAYDVADYKVNLQLTNPLSYSGKPLTVAASAPAITDEDGYQYSLDSARTFALSVSDQFEVLTTTVGNTTLMGYAFPKNEIENEAVLNTTAEALTLYSDLFESSYPHENLSIVEADFLNGMEYEGIFFLSYAFYDAYTGTPESNLIIVAAHETAHQWFYGLVGNDQALEPWLDEALCTYSERLFYEHVYPDLEEWWWDNRVYFHEPEGWVDSTVYELPFFYPYRDAVYLRGALFLEELRNLIGDETFFNFLPGYIDKYTHTIASGDDFFTTLGIYTDADLNKLFGEYFSHR